MAQLDARLVRALGLGAEAATFYQAAAAAGLRPPARFGTEVVARLLGLRTNHPAGQDDLERLPSDPAPRAEAAYSAAADPAHVGVGDEGRGGRRRRLRDPGAHALAAPRADDRGRLHRLPVRLGRRERAAGIALRPPGTRRVRLLRFRLAGLQASVLSRRTAARRKRCAAEPLPRWPARSRAG